MKHKSLSVLASVGCAMLLCGPSPVSAQSVGQAASFAIVGGAEVRANGAGSVVNGNVGIDPAAATFIFGFPGGATISAGFANQGNNALAIAAAVDVQTLYDSGAMAPGVPATPVALNLGGPANDGIYPPGKYTTVPGTALLAAGTSMTLNGPGTYIFTVASDLTTLNTATINLINGADACDVWWRVPTQATIANANFPGTIVSNANITLDVGANLLGRALTTDAGRVILQGGNTVGGCSSPVGPVPTLPQWAVIALMALLSAAGFTAMRKRTA